MSIVADLDGLEGHRRLVPTSEGELSVLDVGSGPPALLVHGVGTNALLWRHVMTAVAPQRRCVAVDLPLHGRSPLRPGQAVGLAPFARLLARVCEQLDLEPVDLVANDTGGAVAQIFAAEHPRRVRTLTLTNCEAHDNVPPRAFRPTVLLARAGLLAWTAPWILRDPDRARRLVYGTGYERPTQALPEPVVRSFLEPLVGTRPRARQFQRWLTALDPADLLAAEPGLRRLAAPALVVWGTGDVFFDPHWAHWLADTLPGARPVVELPGARLFFCDERAAELVPHLQRHWADAG